MPKRVYDFYRKFGLHPKEVIAKAENLGISGLKVAASVLNDCDAARLEEELTKANSTPTPKTTPKIISGEQRAPLDIASTPETNTDVMLPEHSAQPVGTQSELTAALFGRPKFIVESSEKSPPAFVKLAMFVWLNSDQFIRWPQRAYCFWPGQIRATGTGRTPCYEYSREQLTLIGQAGLEPRAWNNDPAIFAFKLAGGDRPQRADWKWEWTIHHIYDGKFEAQPGWQTTHAVRHPAYFTEAAGLVALHPIADSLASEVAFFAWLLRHEAFKKFGFDPDGVFNRLS